MRLFVSYARVDKPYCIQIINTLDVHDVWYDHRLHVGQNWWDTILRHLEWCEGFVYLLSPESVASQYCRREFELAQRFGRHIFPVLLRSETQIPEVLKDLQYVDLSMGLTVETVTTLLNSIYLAETEPKRQMPAQFVDREAMQPPQIDMAQVISNGMDAMAAGQYDQAVFLFKQAKVSGHLFRFVNIDGVLAEAEKALEHQIYIREADREYQPIVALLKDKRMAKLGYEAFEVYRQHYPDYDPGHIASCLASSNGPLPSGGLPLLNWIHIPAGSVNFQLPSKQQNQQTFWVDDFYISQYPVTNAQYAMFIQDPDGYCNLHWWDFSAHARIWRQKNPNPTPSAFKGDIRPREMVSWYDSIAFCNWLSVRLDIDVTLPTFAEWQLAFQGENGYEFPWGDTFNKDYCNTAERGLKMTSPVNAYPAGASPHDVYDMSGNVWEWCINLNHEHGFDTNLEGAGHRVARGGSFMSPGGRARSSFHYYFPPQSHAAAIGFRIVAQKKSGE